ncbi:SCP-like protein [Ancylostoma caninum]|uniref:SCP-like protein n=1 Tax=Ancylostoma caninum TaxID=29170 RepID=A0A368GJL0_ANCCA|nr:SCP-like protein [Ancylostoma caninum]
MNAMGDTCQPQQRFNTKGLADFFHHDYDPEYNYWAGKILKNALNAHLVQIDLFPLSVPSHANKVIYNGDDQLKTYANLVRSTNTELGCAINRCFGFGENSRTGEGAAMYCLLNSRNITDGETVYETAAAPVTSCADVTCPAGASCDPNTFSCVFATAKPKAPPGASPQASFPSGPSSQCSHAYAGIMTDVLRNEYVRLHNLKRSLLATGQVSRKNGKHLPTASNMQKMAYDCKLEEGAIIWASQCPSSQSKENTRPGVGENFMTFPSAPHPTFEGAVENSINAWWRVIGNVNYWPRVVVFRRFHQGAPICSFTQMAWAVSSKLGCAIVKCAGRYVSTCRYSPRGNIAVSSIYQNGAVCSACPSGKQSCNKDEGLCF